ncbi:4-fold beta flower protein [Microseira wollei]|uniref:4-fold beta flower domain-containing protein n=1 Tax=Microseira wollei NIES-4236 TaxID=2530354 RepID=A0AAV3XII6_9CYAN|nr:hypothetical protein [Microseira wollei]GET42737.1 hypothetical protein MiSe_75550 [Microseira wollei NIES-4236]
MHKSPDDSTAYSSNSQFDDLIQSLGIDLHPNINTEHSHTNWQDNSQQHNPYPDNLNHTGIPDLTQNSWDDSSHHHPQFVVGAWAPSSQWHDTENGFTHYHAEVSATKQVLNSSYSSAKDGPYINIDRYGDIHLHKLDGTTQTVGHVSGQQFYNWAGEHIGYLKNGHIYRWINDTSVGRVEGGHIYQENGKEIGRADTDLEGAAHMLFVVRGGTF